MSISKANYLGRQKSKTTHTQQLIKFMEIQNMHTPETDAEVRHWNCARIDFARKLERQRDALLSALKQIERWEDFPSTGEVWTKSQKPVSYGAAYGSNGERDYMRSVARQAIALVKGEPS